METDKDSMLFPRAAEGGQEIWAGRIKHPQDFTGPGNDAKVQRQEIIITPVAGDSEVPQ